MATAYTQVPIINDGSYYVSDLQMTFVSTTQISIAKGAARDSKNLNDIILKSDLSIKTSTKGLNGIDSGVVQPTKRYALFVVGDSTGYYQTGAILSLNDEKPLLPFGYDMYRRIGWVMTNGSSQVIKFYQYGTDSTRKYYYDIADTDGSVVLSGGSETTYTKVQLSGGTNAPLIPPFPTKVFFRVEYDQDNIANNAMFQPYGSDPAAIPTATVGFGVVSLQYSTIFLITNADDTGIQSIQYKVGSGDATSLIITGYEDYL